MNSWVKETIGSICDKGGGLVKTGPFGSQLHQSDYQEEGTPVVMPTDIQNGSIDTKKIARVSQNHVERLKQYKLSIGDIVYGRRGDIGRQALVKKENEGWLCGTGCLRITLAKSNVIPLFLHIYLQMPAVINWIQNQAIGATMPNLNTKILRSIPINYPPLPIQKKIAAILSAYDDLIENNNHRIAILEKMAEEIYREWFVRMRFLGYEKVKFNKGVPEEWEVKKLGDIINLIMGQSPKSEFYNTNGEGFPFNQGVGTYGNRFPKKEIFCSTKGRMANKGDILFSVRAPVGRLNIADCKMIIGRGLASINHKKGFNSYLFYMLKHCFSNEDIIGNGAIFNSVGKDELKNFKILYPTETIITTYDTLSNNLDLKINKLIQSIDILTKLRNSLLSRLISGKLPIDNLDITFPPSMEETSA